jgi:antitoxin (DNA-binding transcriptional repressor) of toxin-antitoxin stability system
MLSTSSTISILSSRPSLRLGKRDVPGRWDGLVKCIGARMGYNRCAMNVTVEDVKRDPEGVLHRVLEGETLVITERDRPVAEIRPLEASRRPRPFGLAAGTFVVPDDFDAPLPEEFLKFFQ